jgi:hypothetical protein
VEGVVDMAFGDDIKFNVDVGDCAGDVKDLSKVAVDVAVAALLMNGDGIFSTCIVLLLLLLLLFIMKLKSK